MAPRRQTTPTRHETSAMARNWRLLLGMALAIWAARPLGATAGLSSSAEAGRRNQPWHPRRPPEKRRSGSSSSFRTNPSVKKTRASGRPRRIRRRGCRGCSRNWASPRTPSATPRCWMTACGGGSWPCWPTIRNSATRPTRPWRVSSPRAARCWPVIWCPRGWPPRWGSAMPATSANSGRANLPKSASRRPTSPDCPPRSARIPGTSWSSALWAFTPASPAAGMTMPGSPPPRRPSC